MLELVRLLYSMLRDGVLEDEAKVYVGDARHEKFHSLAEGILWNHERRKGQSTGMAMSEKLCTSVVSS